MKTHEILFQTLAQADDYVNGEQLAKELGVYIHKDPVLLNELKALKEGEQVPEQLFQIIAEILAFSYLLQGKTPESYIRADGTKAINTKA